MQLLLYATAYVCYCITMQLIEPISRKLIRIGKLYQNVLARHTAHLNVTRYHYILSLICYHDGQLSQKALAQILGKDKSAMVSIINLLSAKGFVYRENNPNDRREQLIKVTEKAKQAVPQIVATFQNINTNITEGISTADMKIFESVLLRMQNNIKPQPTNNPL
ncbi:MarR family winged helix-turn-helix transcriptional regulator [Mucilaginibacter sp. SP1R1]|uniref:MarR family winged helix-turn-helix transcriptional regulator n=1 Tax=Mucilaginibacter sp. SP1R1 TaxID=2723091 RepID=UPI00160A0F13|nr:MarR family transcriptional regulator [Mucilaginibacter sp. SP1R1]MBB6150067.1 MarR family transcriptional regulator for hemolysin [Mucilaginibacter sp. SP1R1]